MHADLTVRLQQKLLDLVIDSVTMLIVIKSICVQICSGLNSITASRRRDYSTGPMNSFPAILFCLH
jgi:hypothetical protein